MTKDFIQWCASVRALSKETCRQYQNIINLFVDYCEEHNLALYDFYERDVNDWIISQTSQGIKSVTINNRISCLRMMYDYFVRFHGWYFNPFVGVQALKRPKLLPKFIEDNIIHKAVAGIKGIGFYECRARAVIMFFYTTGVRRAELAEIRCSDISLDSRAVRIFGKGRKERFCPLPDTLLPYLVEWQDARSGMIPKPSEYYFCSSVGKQMKNTAIAQLVRSVFTPYLPKKMCHPHILRHSFATRLMRAGVPIVDIARLMGHTSTATTLRYLSLSSPQVYSSVVNNVF